MNNPFVRLVLILSVPMLIGFGIGYSVRSPHAAAAETDASIDQNAPTNQPVQDKPADQTDAVAASRRNAITRAVAKVSPAVVGINVTEIQQFRDPMFQFFDDPFFRRFFGDRTYRQEVKGLGSGFIISKDGYIVTNDHVAGNATEITVTLVGGKRMRAKLVGTDHTTDVSLLKVDGDNLPPVTFGNSDDVVIGEWAIAMGNPFGLFEINDKPTVTVGVISSTGMKLGQLDNRFYRDMIETDAAINGGNSGGPLVNSAGEVVGMNTLLLNPTGQTSTYIGYGFAIPINKVKKVIAELRQKGKVTHDVATGFDAQAVDVRIARYMGLSRVEGIIVSEVRSGGPAEKAGLKVGDIILSVNGENVNSEEDFYGAVVDSTPGDVLDLKVYREKKAVNVQLRLARSSQ